MNDALVAKPRLVIYGTGQYGCLITQLALERGWQVVAAYNRAGDKVGQDLGVLAGVGAIGVIVEDCDTSSYDRLRGKADIAAVATTNSLSLNMPGYERLMSAGLNVVCHGAESYYPQGCDPEIAATLDALARKHGVTFTGGGIWDMSRVWAGLLAIGPSTKIRALSHSSITDVEGQCATKEQAAFVGVGMTVGEYEEGNRRQQQWPATYTTVLQQVLVASGYNVTRSHTRIEPIQFDVPVTSKLMEATYPPGTCLGTRIIGNVETEQGVSAQMSVELRLFRPGEVEHTFWSVDGLPRTRVRVERDDSAHATAANLFNRIPQIIAARPGIVTVSELGPLRHSALISA